THKPGWKFNEYELKGVPLRIAIGPRDLKNNSVEFARRDTLEKSIVPIDGMVERVQSALKAIHESLYNKAHAFRAENTRKVDSWEDFTKLINNEGGFIAAHWD